ncbi:non-specific serine/threonine protein kinase [Anaeramoeba flamelloides]|uniref:non-specific serine/threonine protein kinase n=1 Tax=Anaeramoeba flamelloides TaxID=1746091 RepID=A0ABQ8ZF27_9EUKA|nr:non-specific serine/threonine protein kinase [Anaeramoeba flamelloides]
MSNSEIVMSGYLVKQGGKIKTWRKRWFVIRGNVLYYYKKKTSKFPLGMLPLSQSVVVDYAKKRRKKFVFSVDVPNARKYFINATSETEREDWMGAISKSIKTQKLDKVSFNDFEIITVLGRGTYGKVMLVKEKNSGKRLAMKTLHKSLVADNQQISQTMSERNVLMRVNHPFMIGLKYSFQTLEKLYMVLDYAPGGEVFQHLKNAGRFAQSRACLYSAEIILGLEHLHKMDIIYRDLKPENLLLDEEGHIKITDFGLVKTDLNKKFGGKTNTFCGTPEYVAPEILKEEEYNFTVDWWSFGILLFEFLVGIPPFFSQDRQELYKKILYAELKLPFFLRDDAKDLITKLLNRDKENRFGANGAEEIKNHEFFEGVDWDKLYNKEYKPEFIPKIKEIDDITNFDDEFTNEEAVDSLPQESAVGKLTEKDFKGFTYLGTIEGISVMKNTIEKEKK